MERNQKLLLGIDRTARIIEIGPSYNPVAPKAAGWQTVVLDYATQAELKKIYQEQNVQLDSIEPVDFLWSGGAVHEVIPAKLHGCFNACIASHVIEHIPNPIAFFQSLDRVLGADGILSLAVPDKRFCFDFFRPLTFAPGWIEAFERNAARHSRRNLLECGAYQAYNGDSFCWDQFHNRPMRLPGDLIAAKTQADNAGQTDAQPYVDCHAWCFTPSSFRLLLLELAALGLIGFRIVRLFPTEGCEFIVSLRRGRDEHADEMQTRRLELLKAIVGELGEQNRRMEERITRTTIRRAIRKLSRLLRI